MNGLPSFVLRSGRGTLASVHGDEVDLQQSLADAVDALEGAGVPWALCGGMACMKRLSRRMKDLADLERLEGTRDGE